MGRIGEGERLSASLTISSSSVGGPQIKEGGGGGTRRCHQLRYVNAKEKGEGREGGTPLGHLCMPLLSYSRISLSLSYEGEEARHPGVAFTVGRPLTSIL